MVILDSYTYHHGFKKREKEAILETNFAYLICKSLKFKIEIQSNTVFKEPYLRTPILNF